MGIAAGFMVPHPPLIVPEIGRGEEKGIAGTIASYEEVGRRVGQYAPETIVILSPHQIMYADYFHISPGRGAKGDFARFGAGQVACEITYDEEFVQTLCKIAQEGPRCVSVSGDGEDPQSGGPVSAGTLGEREKQLDHGTMVPLYFLNKYWTDYRLVRIGLAGLPFIEHYRLGQCIQRTAEALGRKTVLIASGDLSHRLKEDGPYGFREEGPEYDRRIMDVMSRAAFGELFDFSEEFCDKAGECGHRSFIIMAGALDGREVRAERLSYEGPFGVGYGICAYEVQGAAQGRDFGRQYQDRRKKELEELRAKEDAYVRLARQTVETYILTGEKPKKPENLPEEMCERQAGVFVSIKEDGKLRGCIGTIQAVQASIAEEIMENAVSASTRDPRFSPIEPYELDRLVISVDVLGETERIASADELDVKRYGVIVTKGYRRGLLLPNLEGVDTVEQQIAIAKEKAGISAEEDVELERFEVVRHH